MNAIGILLTLIFSLMALLGSRRVALLGLMLSVCYITQGQQFTFLGFHFTSVRVVLLLCLVRLAVRGEFRAIQLNKIDYAFILFALTSLLCPTLRERDSQTWVYQLGVVYNVLLPYFAFRGLILNWEELQDLLPAAVYFVIPMAFFMLWETKSGHSVFAFLGGLPQIDPDRGGHFRATGAFRGAHCAGGFGASLIPLFVCLYWTRPQYRLVAAIGVIAGTAITYAANCSGPLMAYLSAWLALAFWPLHNKMRGVRWGIVIGLIALGLVMKAPIWYVMAKISALTGGDGWSRSNLMEQCFNHFFDWWALGTSDTSTWAPTLMAWGGADLCNLYVSAAVEGGLFELVFLILLLVYCFSNLGLARKSINQGCANHEQLFWCVGCVLFAHVMTLFSVTYWDQMGVIWWGTIGIIASISSSALRTTPYIEDLEAVGEPADHDIAVAVSKEPGWAGKA